MPQRRYVALLWSLALVAITCGAQEPRPGPTATPWAVIDPTLNELGSESAVQPTEPLRPAPTLPAQSLLSPSPTPPPRYMEFCAPYGRGACQLVNLSNSRTPSPTDGIDLYRFDFSPDRTRIANLNTRLGPGTGAGIEIIELPSQGSRKVGSAGRQHDELAPAWSPDGTMLAFENPRGFGEVPLPVTIDIATADGSKQWTVSDGLRSARNPAWSPDGSRLAFSTEEGLLTVKVDGSGRRNVTGTLGGAQPAWLTDTELAFVRRRPGEPGDLFAIATDGDGLRRLTVGGAYASSVGLQPFPQSPDGKCLAYLKGPVPNVFTVCIDRPEYQITSDGNGHRYAWLTDGRIAVESATFQVIGGVNTRLPTACPGLLAVRIETGDRECIVY